jgi:heterodisulfide reductase subunit C
MNDVCIHCGICTASCPSGWYTPLVTRRVVGGEVNTMEDVWACVTCYQCEERCPREIKVVERIIEIRNELVREGKIFESHREAALKLIESGRIVPWNEKSGELREELGLPRKREKCAEEVKTLLKLTGFESLIGGG